MAFFVILCLALALWPTAGRMKLGHHDDEPEFSNFSWFSMMFGAGIGIGMLTFATAEPMYHWASNPDTIRGLTEGSSAENVRPAYVWSFTHWGLAAWASYAVVGLSLAFFAYRRNLPLTIRSALAPIFGERLSGTDRPCVDIVAVVATVLGVAQTLGFGVEQFVAGLSRIGFGDWLYTTTADGGQTTSTAAIVFALLVIMGASTLSALSGVGKGIKWLSNINMGLSFFLLLFFLAFGSTFFGLQALVVGSSITSSRSRRTSSRSGSRTAWKARRPRSWPAGRVAGRSSTGPGGSRSRPSSACSLRGSPRAGRSANTCWAR
jgi:choline/glycine/proline betaine transport protein